MYRHMIYDQNDHLIGTIESFEDDLEEANESSGSYQTDLCYIRLEQHIHFQIACLMRILGHGDSTVRVMVMKFSITETPNVVPRHHNGWPIDGHDDGCSGGTGLREKKPKPKIVRV
jgi:hypothetical protein